MDTSAVAVVGGWAAVFAGATGHDKLALGIVAVMLAFFAWGPGVNLETVGTSTVALFSAIGIGMAAIGVCRWLRKEGW